jgi:hypothetical protein
LADHSETRASYSRGGNTDAVELTTLHEKIRELCHVPKLPDLSPETATLETQMKIGHGLPLDENARSEVVVADRKPVQSNFDPQCSQRLRDAATMLERIRDDPAHWQDERRGHFLPA